MQAGPWYREGSWLTDRARRVVPGTRAHPSPYHPLQPLQGFRGPLRCTGMGSSRGAGRLGTPRYTHPYTHPYTRPWPYTAPHALVGAVYV